MSLGRLEEDLDMKDMQKHLFIRDITAWCMPQMRAMVIERDRRLAAGLFGP